MAGLSPSPSKPGLHPRLPDRLPPRPADGTGAGSYFETATPLKGLLLQRGSADTREFPPYTAGPRPIRSSGRLCGVIALGLGVTAASQLVAYSARLSPALAALCSLPIAFMLSIGAGYALLVEPMRAVSCRLARLHADARARELQHQQLLSERDSALRERTQALIECTNLLHRAYHDPLPPDRRLGQVERELLAGQLVGPVAHDLNNLLATVLGCLELMDRRADDPIRLGALTSRSMQAIERAATLSSSVAQFARRQSRPPALTDLNALVAGLRPLIASTFGRRARLVVELAPDLLPVPGEPTQLEIALVATCIALRGALDAAQIRLTTHAATNSASAPSLVSEAPRICLAISSESASLADTDLTLARRAAAAAGAIVTIECDDTNEGPYRMRVLLCVLPRSVVAPLSVVLVDDDFGARQVTRGMLTELGCTVAEEPGWKEAIESAARTGSNADIIILDDGAATPADLEFARTAREDGMDVPIIVTPAHRSCESPLVPYHLISDAVLPKPFSLSGLRQTLAAVLRDDLGRAKFSPVPGFGADGVTR